MIPRADLSFFGLGNRFGGKDLEFRAKERGSSWRSEEERKADVLPSGNSRKTLTRDIGLQVRTIQKNIRSIRVNPEFPDSNPEYPGSSDSRI